MREGRYIDAVLRWRVWVAIVLAMVTGAAGYFATKVRFDNDIEVWFLENDTALVAYREFLELFEADEITIMAVFAEEIFTPEVLGSLHRLTEATAAVPRIHRVRSLTNVRIATATGDSIDIAPLVERIPTTAAEAEALRGPALANRLISGLLVSKDARAAALIIELSPEAQDFASKIAIVKALEEIMAREAEIVDVRLVGSAPLNDAWYHHTLRDFLVLGPAAMILVIVSILVIYRRLSAVLIPLAVIALAALWLFGLIGALGYEIDAISTLLPAIILSVGVADSMHLLSEYYHEIAKGHTRWRAVCNTVESLLMPCLMTSATTAAGLLSLLVSDLHPVRQFGWQAAVGVGNAFVLTVTLVPLLLLVVRPPDARSLRRHTAGPLARVLSWLGRCNRGRSQRVALASLVILLLAVWAVTKLDTRGALEYLRRGDPLQIAIALVDDKLGCTTSLEIFARAPNQGLKDPEVLRRIAALQRALEAQPGVTKVLSVVDELKEMNRLLSPGVDAHEVPDSRAKVAQFYLLLEAEDDFRKIVQDDYSVARVTAWVQMSKAAVMVDRIPELDAFLAREYNDDALQAWATGYLKLEADLQVYLFRTLTRSFLVAFAVIIVMLAISLHSVRLAAFSTIPTLAPILAGMGCIALLDIPLDPGTVMIASIALGLVVDDTLHFLVRLRRYVEAGLSMEDGLEQTITVVGPAIIVTSLALCGGFATLLLASFAPNVNFGAGSVLVILLALVAVLLVLPAALVLIRPRM